MPRLIVASVLLLAALAGCRPRMPLRLYYAPSGGMLPTIKVGSKILVNQTAYMFVSPRRGDIAVFTPPIRSGPFIKRIIAGPGDRFRMERGTVYVNGQAENEPFISERAAYDMVVRDYGIYVNSGAKEYDRLSPEEANIPPRTQWTAPDRVPSHCYIVLGDNRNDSEDSHVWGFAQDSGNFASGEIAGKPASFIGQVIQIYRNR